MENNWSYCGIFLLENEKNILLEKFSKIIPDEWKRYCDHMTCIFNTGNNDENIFNFCKNNINKEFTIDIVSIGHSDRAIAFGIKADKIPSANKHKHITLAVAPGAKPVESNYIQNWIEIEQAIPIKGIMKIIYKK